MEIPLYDTDTTEEIARKLSAAVNAAHDGGVTVTVYYRGQPYAQVIPVPQEAS